MLDTYKIFKILSKPWLVPGYVRREVVQRRGRIRLSLASQPSELWGRTEKSRYKEELLIATEQVVSNASYIAYRFNDLFERARLAVDRELLHAHADAYLNGRTYVLYNYHDVPIPRNIENLHRDYITGYVYKMSHFSESMKFVSDSNGTDIKRIWELARFQQLVSVAYWYYLSHEDKYAECVISVIKDYIDSNPYDVGPLWQPSMEVGIRLVNLILAFSFISESKLCDEVFVELFKVSSIQHYDHIIRNPENLGEHASNHHLGCLTGEAAYFALLFGTNVTDKRVGMTHKSLTIEMQQQILESGMDYEGSTSYQRLVGEMLCYALEFFRCCDMPLSGQSYKTLVKMTKVSSKLQLVEGEILQIGDNDSGRVVQIVPEKPNDYRSFFRLAKAVASGVAPIEYRTEVSAGFDYIDPSIVSINTDRFTLFMTAFDATAYGMGDHSHNDLLSFALAYDGRPFVVDPGTGSYTGNHAVRNLLRSTASHSVVAVDGLELRPMRTDRLFGWSGSRGKSALSTFSDDNNYIIFGNTTNFKAQNGCVWSRNVRVDLDCKEVFVEDSIEGAFELLEICIPLHPSVKVEVNGNSLILTNSEVALEVCGSWSLHVDSMLYSEVYDTWCNAKCLKGHSKDSTNVLRFIPARKSSD